MSGGKMLPPSQCELQKVQSIQFEVFKASDIEQHAVCCVHDPRGYVNNKPLPGGVADLRMGSTDFEFACETCNMKHPDCPGHFGYIDLAEPMFNIGLFDVTLQVLRCVCKTCGALLVPRSDPKIQDAQSKNNAMRLSEVVSICQSKKKCGIVNPVTEDEFGNPGVFNPGSGCGADQIHVGRFLDRIYAGLVIRATAGDNELRWYAAEALQVLDKISDEDAIAMGFNPRLCHPRDLIITKLPVPPPQVRPTVSFGTARSDNELTHKLVSILKENQRMRQAKATRAGRETVDEIREVLQEHIGTYFHNASTYYMPSTINQKMRLKSLAERLKGKHGRLRGNLMGKRVDFSARTVITGDPVIDVDEVGVPYSVAMTLTFPELVNHSNRKRLTEIVRRKTYPSANNIIHPNGTVKRVSVLKNRENITLQVGDIVERHVTNGDVVLFNRQPTLHRMSMMGHRVRVLPFNTFRLNLSCTTPYNADFDGDEMNLHVPQSLLTKAELIEMMMVPKNFVSPNKSAPCMGIVQDSLLGCFRMTDKETFLDKYFVQSVAMWIDKWDLPVPAILKPQPLWTGKQIFSLILPEINFSTMDEKNKASFPEEDKFVLIRRGQLITGDIRKSHVGAAPGSLIHLIFNEKGSDDVARFINGVQRITQYFLYNYSFSVGVQDTVAGDDTINHTNKILSSTMEDVKSIASKANNGDLQRKAGMTLLQSFEKDVNTALNECRETAAKYALANVRRTNSFRVMIDCGSKGSHLNICQIAVMVGQQNVNGARIPFGFRRRTLPHFMQDDYGDLSRGMVNHGYVEGLKPYEFFFHTMAGREGLIDTAVKTADTGYLQRKLIKALEDIHAAYDGTVRNANRELIQMVYGEDGLDGARIEGAQVFEIPWLNNEEMEKKFRFEYGAQGEFTDRVGGAYMSREVKRALRADPENIRRLEDEYRQLMIDRDESRKFLEIEKKPMKISLPVNVERLIRNAQSTIGVRSTTSNLNPVRVVESVNQLQLELKQFFASYNKTDGKHFSNLYNQERVESALKLFMVHLRTQLASKRVLCDHKLNDKAFEYLLGEIRTKYREAMIQPGEMIGAIAAQSCGEPATQMTLNTFHNAGISSKNVTLGVPRLVELLNVSKSQKYSSMTIALIPEWSGRSECEAAVHKIEYASLETITKRIQIHYDPDLINSNIPEDRDFVANEYDPKWYDDDINDARETEKLRAECSPWVVRLELDESAIIDKKLQLEYIKQRLVETELGSLFNVEVSLEQKGDRIMRLRLKVNDPNNPDTVKYLKKIIPALLSKVHLSGIRGIKKVLTQEMVEYSIDEEKGALSGNKVWCLDTEGTAMKVVMGGVVDEKGQSIVNFRKTSSNNIPEIYRELGIEAARRKLLLEMRVVYGGYSLSINYRHYSILVDAMCQRGYLMAISRVGINRSDAGPMMRASFEETVKVLMGAAAFGERDPVRGVSANIIVGNQARIGTGIFDIALNMKTLENAVPQDVAILPGKDINVYHGVSSVAPMMSNSVAHRVNQTPMVTDPSMEHGGNQSQSYAYPDSGALGGMASVDYTPVHGTTGSGGLSVGARGGASAFTADDFSAAYSSVGSSAHGYEPIDSSTMPAFHSDATFHIQSSEQAPYNAMPDYTLSNVPLPPPSAPYSSFAMSEHASRSVAAALSASVTATSRNTPSISHNDSASVASSQAFNSLYSRQPQTGGSRSHYSQPHSLAASSAAAFGPGAADMSEQYVPVTPDYAQPTAPAPTFGASAAQGESASHEYSPAHQ